MGSDVIGKADALLVTRQNTAGTSTLGGTGTFATLTQSSGTYSGWSQIVSSMGSDSLITSILIGYGTVPGSNDFPVLIGVGIGGSGSEVSVLEQPIPTAAASTQLVIDVTPMIRVAAGQRVSVRIYGGNNGSTYRVALFAVPYANLAVS